LARTIFLLGLLFDTWETSTAGIRERRGLKLWKGILDAGIGYVPGEKKYEASIHFFDTGRDALALLDA
jgi:hypothetical protein